MAVLAGSTPALPLGHDPKGGSRPWSAPNGPNGAGGAPGAGDLRPLRDTGITDCFAHPVEANSVEADATTCAGVHSRVATGLCVATILSGSPTVAGEDVPAPEGFGGASVVRAVFSDVDDCIEFSCNDMTTAVLIVSAGEVCAGSQPFPLASGRCVFLPASRAVSIRPNVVPAECMLMASTAHAASQPNPSEPTHSPPVGRRLSNDQLTHIRQEHSDYVTFFRKQLHKSQQFALLRDECVQLIHRFWKKEEDTRFDVLLGEVVAREEVMRNVHSDLDMLEREAYRKERYENTYLPWCNLGCKYCCKLQHELYQQVCQMARREVETLVTAEATAVDRLLSEEEICWERIQVGAWSGVLQQEMFIAGRRLLDRKSRAMRLLVTLDEQKAYLDLAHAMHAGHEAARFHDDSWTLRNQHLELCRLQDLLQLREESVAQKMIHVQESTEGCHRQGVQSDEVSAWTDILLQASASQLSLASLNNEAKLQYLQDQVEALSAYKAEREAEEMEQQKAKLEEEQAMLIAELDVIKGRMKKNKKAQGKVVLPQSVLQSEQCERCKAKVTKQTYFRHVDRECPFRPVECKMCLLVMRAHELSDHMLSQCLVRNVVCEECTGVYQARFIEGHLPLCSKIIKAKAVVPTLHPYLGIEAAEAGGEGLLVTAIKPGSPLDGHIKEEDLLVKVAQFPVPTKADLENALAQLMPGDTCDVTILPSSKADGPWWGGDAEEVSSYMSFTATIQTTIPLAEYLEMVWLLEEDERRHGELVPDTAAA